MRSLNPLVLALGGLASAAEAPLRFPGERLHWEVSFAGVAAGTAWSAARAEGDLVVFEGGCRNADWYAPFYTIDDSVKSTWRPGGGSVRYQTRFREGRFSQDQDMRLLPDGVEVWRRQWIDEAWKEWTDRYGPSPGAEDPVSALYALRLLDGEGPWEYPVWSGRKTFSLQVSAGEPITLDTVLGEVAARPYSLVAPHKGEVQQRGGFVVYLTEDARRVPVRAELKANVGTFQADLIGYLAPDGRAWGALEGVPP